MPQRIRLQQGAAFPYTFFGLGGNQIVFLPTPYRVLPHPGSGPTGLGSLLVAPKAWFLSLPLFQLGGPEWGRVREKEQGCRSSLRSFISAPSTNLVLFPKRAPLSAQTNTYLLPFHKILPPANLLLTSFWQRVSLGSSACTGINIVDEVNVQTSSLPVSCSCFFTLNDIHSRALPFEKDFLFKSCLCWK